MWQKQAKLCVHMRQNRHTSAASIRWKKLISRKVFKQINASKQVGISNSSLSQTHSSNEANFCFIYFYRSKCFEGARAAPYMRTGLAGELLERQFSYDDY